jgi:acetyl-CoA decarbonylase/synthase complex subunit gamma
VATVRFGRRGKELALGGETVLFRHEKRFNSPTVLAVAVESDLGRERWTRALAQAAACQFQRVGQDVGVEAALLRTSAGDADALSVMAEDVLETPLAPALGAPAPGDLQGALDVLRGRAMPLLWPLGGDLTSWTELALRESCPLAVDHDSLPTAGSELKIVVRVRDNEACVPSLTALRRAAILDRRRDVGWPLATAAGGPHAAAAVCRYADFVAVPCAEPEDLLALVTLRLNLYTDPQKPVMMDPGLYPVGSPGPDSPVVVTTNFSLTYYSVHPEVEASRVPCWILLTDSEGQSVLTAWAADRFSAPVIRDAISSSGLGDRVSHRELIIPGLVAIISGDVEEGTGWAVRVGPREASGLPRFLKNMVGGKS